MTLSKLFEMCSDFGATDEYKFIAQEKIIVKSMKDALNSDLAEREVLLFSAIDRKIYLWNR